MPMGTGIRNRLQVDERRAQLLEVGLQLFSTVAYDEVQVGDIAKLAGVSKGLLYHYFGGKKDFYVACVRAAADILVGAVDPDPDLTPPERVRAGIGAYLTFVEGRADAYLALMGGGLGADSRVAEIIDETRYAIVSQMTEGLGLTEPRPVFRATLRAWIGSVEGVSVDWLRHRDTDREYLLELLVSSLYTHLVVAVASDPDAGIVLDPIL